MEPQTFTVQRWLERDDGIIDIGPLVLKTQIPQAWLISWDAPHLPPYVQRRIVGMLNPRISSTDMLSIVESLAICNGFGLGEQMALMQDKPPHLVRAGFNYLNDGSECTDSIHCREPVPLDATRVSDIALYHDQSSQPYLVWKHPHMIVERGERFIQFWEELIATPTQHIHRILNDHDKAWREGFVR